MLLHPTVFVYCKGAIRTRSKAESVCSYFVETLARATEHTLRDAHLAVFDCFAPLASTSASSQTSFKERFLGSSKEFYSHSANGRAKMLCRFWRRRRDYLRRLYAESEKNESGSMASGAVRPRANPRGFSPRRGKANFMRDFTKIPHLPCLPLLFPKYLSKKDFWEVLRNFIHTAQTAEQKCSAVSGAGGGIRTPVGLPPNGFQDRLVMTASIHLRICAAKAAVFIVCKFYRSPKVLRQ